MRKTTLILISVLLHNNPALQYSFCDKLNIAFAPGKVYWSIFKLILTSRFHKIGMKYGKNKEVLRLIKDEQIEGKIYEIVRSEKLFVLVYIIQKLTTLSGKFPRSKALYRSYQTNIWHYTQGI